MQRGEVEGQGQRFIKPVKPDSINFNEEADRQHLLDGLNNPNRAYLLVTHRNILCPVGYEDTPLVPIDAYKRWQDIPKEKLEMWIMHCTTQRFDPTFAIKRWKHLVEHLTTEWPNYTDL